LGLFFCENSPSFFLQVLDFTRSEGFFKKFGLWLSYPRIEARAGYRIDEVDTLRALKAVEVPVLFIAAERDVRMPPELVRSLYDTCPSPKSYYLIPGAGHEFRPFELEFQQTVTDFILRRSVR
jgi:pimeloyl-ACP methyl ester carboxylesterase